MNVDVIKVLLPEMTPYQKRVLEFVKGNPERLVLYRGRRRYPVPARPR